MPAFGSIGNSLIQRVQRHAQLTTLFRATAAVATAGGRGQPLTLGQALSLAPEPSEPASALGPAWPDVALAEGGTALEYPEPVAAAPALDRPLPAVLALGQQPTALTPRVAPGHDRPGGAAVVTNQPSRGALPPGGAPVTAAQRVVRDEPLPSGQLQPPSTFVPEQPPVADQVAPGVAATPLRRQTRGVAPVALSQARSVGVPAGVGAVAAAGQPGQNLPLNRAAPPTAQPSAVQAQAIQPAAVITPPPAAPPLSTVAPAPSEEERTWARLQAIYRGHKAREARTQTASGSASEVHSALPQAGASDQTLSLPVAASPPTQPSATVAPASETIQRQTHAVPPVSAPFPPEEVAPQPAVLATITLPEPAPTTRRAPTAALQLEGGDPAEQLPLEEAALAATALSDQFGEAPSANAATRIAASLPLEAVWPVQRSSHLTSTLAPPAQPDAPADQEFVADPEQSAALDAQVRQQLAQIKTGHPTDSTVELLLPRRPRPVVRSAGGASPAAAPVQRLAGPAASGGAPPDGAATAATRVTELAPTAVGALPVDLWHLIGATPPTAPAAPLPAPAQVTAGPAATDVTAPEPPAVAPDRPLRAFPADGEDHADRAAERMLAASTSAALTPPITAPASPPQVQRQTVAAGPGQNATEAAAVPAGAGQQPAAPASTSAGAEPLPTAAEVAEPQTPGVWSEPAATLPRSATPRSRPKARRNSGEDSASAPLAKSTPETGGVLQRQSAESNAPPDSPAVTAAPSATPPVAAGLDTDELARQVYAQLKRQLRVEQERLGPVVQR